MSTDETASVLQASKVAKPTDDKPPAKPKKAKPKAKPSPDFQALLVLWARRAEAADGTTYPEKARARAIRRCAKELAEVLE